MKALQKAIPIHFMGEFLVLPGQDGTDNKMGHWYTLHWIFSRWFQNSGPEDADTIPTWYMNCVRIIPHDSDRGNLQCSDVIKNLLLSLEE